MPDRWMTYEEAGALFGLSAEAMRKRARRLRWQVRPPNDSHGKAYIQVPDDAELRPAGPPPGIPSGHRPDDRANDLLTELRRRAEAAEQAAKLAESERDTLAQEIISQRERTARAEGEAAAHGVELERLRSDHAAELGRLRADVEHERAERRAERQAAEAERTRLTELLADASMPWWRRLLIRAPRP